MEKVMTPAEYERGEKKGVRLAHSNEPAYIRIHIMIYFELCIRLGALVVVLHGQMITIFG